jgi:beta-glucoside operon transcriptional antiterminator
MIRIKKVLNSSVVIVEDKSKLEYILIGKGIGFGQKIGNVVAPPEASQMLIPADDVRIKEFIGLVTEIPPEFVEFTREIVAYAEEKLATKLNAGIFLTLTNHLHFAVKRYYKGITISNRVFWEIRNYYPQEFKIGSYAVNLMNERFKIELPIKEAANIAFHIINAQGEREETRDGMRYAKMIGSIVNLIRYAYNIETDEEDIHYS